MATRSLSITGRYDEQAAELREIVENTTLTPDSHRMKRLALGVLDSLADVAKPEDTVHLSVNPSEGAGGVRTYTITVTHTPAPAEPTR